MYRNTKLYCDRGHGCWAGAGRSKRAPRGHWERGRGAGVRHRRAGVSGRAGAGGRAGGQAAARAAGAGGAQAWVQAWALGAGLAACARGVGVPVRAGRACWLVNWAKLVHCAPGSVLTQFLDPV